VKTLVPNSCLKPNSILYKSQNREANEGSVYRAYIEGIQGVSQLLKQSDWAQIQDFKWYHNDDYIYW